MLPVNTGNPNQQQQQSINNAIPPQQPQLAQYQQPPPQNLHQLTGPPITGVKRTYNDQESAVLFQDDLSPDKSGHKKKGRKKSFIWAHAITDEQGKVHCKHCNALIRVNYGEKVERLRKHFVKACTKNPFHKDSKEYEELLEAVNAPLQEQKKKSYIAPAGASKSKSNRIISYSVGFVATVLSGPCMMLSQDQIRQLEMQGNRSSNWAGVKLTGAPTATYDSTLEKIRNCHFSGNVYIGVFVKNTSMSGGVQVPSGLYNSNFSGTCVLSDNCYIWNCSAVCNVFVGRNTSLLNCGSVVCEGQTSYGTQRVVNIGPESDGKARPVTLNVTSTFYDICSAVLQSKKANNDAADFTDNSPHLGFQQQDSGGAAKKKLAKTNRNDDYIRYDMSIICDDVEITHCATLRNVFIGSYSKISNATVDSTTLLSHCQVHSSQLSECVMHGSCTVEGFSILDAVLMYPHSSVSHGAKVSESVLGPDCSVSVGECKRSLLGPFVGFHHSALLISTCWPLGRGNISYGAMIGANHTGRSNDQECMPGEGCFFGLASTVKFPFNLLASPYTIIAANTKCNSQRVAFPFSLISDFEGGGVDNQRGMLQHGNLLRPGWVIFSNPYFIERNVSKYTKRRKSTEYRTDFPVFRPSVVEMVIDARARLLKLQQRYPPCNGVEEAHSVLVLDEQQLPGIGACLMMRGDIERAIEAYSQFIRRYALHGLVYMLFTGDSCKQDPEAFNMSTAGMMHGSASLAANYGNGRSSNPSGAGVDSDSEEEEQAMMGAGLGLNMNMGGSSSAMPMNNNSWMGSGGGNAMSSSSNSMSLQPSGASHSAGSVAFVLEDVKRMESAALAHGHGASSSDTAMGSGHGHGGNMLSASSASNMGLGASIMVNNMGGMAGSNMLMQGVGVPMKNSLASNYLTWRNGSLLLLTDSQHFHVRVHQLRILNEEFPGIDFVKLIDGYAAAGVQGVYPHLDRLRQLLQLLVDIERSVAESVFNGRRKDNSRAADIIPDSDLTIGEDDDIVVKAKTRADDVANFAMSVR